MQTERNRVCPVELAPSLVGRVRRWLQNPHTIVAPFVKEGMRVLDVGCGPGYFAVEMAKLVGPTGRVIAVDLQEGMLDLLRDRIKGTEMEQRIICVQCGKNTINVSEPVDFILAFYMVHEVPDKSALFQQLNGVLRRDGRFLLVEPKLFHVSRKAWQQTIARAAENGFGTGEGPRLPLSWTAVLKKS